MPPRAFPLFASALLTCACDGDGARVRRWDVVVEDPRAALLSVHGTAADDVWMVGADTGEGPLVLHWDGAAWQREMAAAKGDLWWVQALPSGTVYLAGSDATVLQYRQGVFERMRTPGSAEDTVFGVWAAAEDDVYAVGSVQGNDGFLWHYDGRSWSELAVAAELPAAPSGSAPGLFKVWGASASDVWVVGDAGSVLRGNVHDGFRRIESGTDERLFTVHGAAGRVVLVGGLANGVALEADGEQLLPITPPGASPLQGVCISDRAAVWAVGFGGSIYAQDGSGAAWRDVPSEVPVQSLHSVWVDPGGGVWSVGGNVLTTDLDHGVALHFDARVSVPAYAKE